MNIEKIYKPGDDFLVLRVSCPGLPDKNISVSVDALVDGKITLDEQMELARQDGEVRLARLNAMNAILGEQ